MKRQFASVVREVSARIKRPLPHAPARSFIGSPEQLTAAASGYTEAKAAASAIEGMLSDFSMATMDSLLALQDVNGTSGAIVEFGVYKGRSAAILGKRARSHERFILVDVAEYLQRDALELIVPNYEFYQCASVDFPRKCLKYKDLKNSCRIIHVDSDHAYRTTFYELAMCNQLLAEGGIAIMDDFTNLNYSQLLAAIYKYLYTTKNDLTMFLVTNEKGYLCRKDDFQRYASFILNDMVPSMAARGIPNVSIARTDYDPEYRAIYLRYNLPSETGPRYGEEIYSHFYQNP